MSKSTDGWIKWLTKSLLRNNGKRLAPKMAEGDNYPCPCCQLPTLRVNELFETCLVCWWEDDGREDAGIQISPNIGYSLNKARQNYSDHGHMFDLGDEIPPIAFPSQDRINLIQYVDDLTSGQRILSGEELGKLLELEGDDLARIYPLPEKIQSWKGKYFV